jgi:hypothetical protein
MLNVIIVAGTISLAAAALWILLRARRRDVGFGSTVSRQWLMQHQGDDRS